MSANKTVAPVVLSCAASLFAVLGLCVGPQYFSVALLLLGLQALRTDMRLALLYAGFALVFALVAFGYGVGKDLAQRDNARDAQVAAAHRQ